jgi:ABC-2 type transport system permease protein
MKRFLALLGARNKEFVRDRGSMAWSLLFPLLIVIGFSFAFSGGQQDVFKVGVEGSASVSSGKSPSSSEFLATKYIQFVEVQELQPALEKLKRHQFDMVVSWKESPRYWINSTSPKGYLLEKIMSGQTLSSSMAREQVSGQEIRYVDWLLAGLLSMNVMFGSLFGVGYVIVRYRKAGVLRRIKTTPVSAFEFLAAQVASRLMLMMVMCVIVLAGCRWLLDVQMVGAYSDLFVVLLLGSLCMISLALVVAARISSEEFAGGLLNLLTWPMMLFSGVWFSLEGTNPVLQKVAQISPLTHLVDAARAIMTEGATLVDVRGHLLILGILSLIFMAISSWLFQWE